MFDDLQPLVFAAAFLAAVFGAFYILVLQPLTAALGI